ncbi:hypothetical protein WG8_1078 [Paenibacillus sp. Aloe-11]|nr:hypothetical protein WG8_1078 [Paenibacillus sp. Aloe-11]
MLPRPDCIAEGKTSERDTECSTEGAEYHRHSPHVGNARPKVNSKLTSIRRDVAKGGPICALRGCGCRFIHAGRRAIRRLGRAGRKESGAGSRSL